MFCTKCGTEIGKYDALCSACGEENKAVESPVKQYHSPYVSPAWANLAFLFSVLIPVVGLVWAVMVGLNTKYIKRSSIAIWISLTCLIIQIPVFAFIFPAIESSLNLSGLITSISSFIEPIFGSLINGIVDLIHKIVLIYVKIATPIINIIH